MTMTNLSRAVRMIAKLRLLLPSKTLKQIYFAYFNSHLLYGAIVWSDAFNMYLKPIASLQNKALGFIGNGTCNDNGTSFFRTNHILKFDDLITYETAKFMFKHDKCVLPFSFNTWFIKISNPSSFHSITPK